MFGRQGIQDFTKQATITGGPVARTQIDEIHRLYGERLQREGEELMNQIESDCLDHGLCPRCDDLMARGWQLWKEAAFYGVDDYDVEVTE